MPAEEGQLERARAQLKMNSKGRSGYLLTPPRAGSAFEAMLIGAIGRSLASVFFIGSIRVPCGPKAPVKQHMKRLVRPCHWWHMTLIFDGVEQALLESAQSNRASYKLLRTTYIRGSSAG